MTQFTLPSDLPGLAEYAEQLAEERVDAYLEKVGTYRAMDEEQQQEVVHIELRLLCNLNRSASRDAVARIIWRHVLPKRPRREPTAPVLQKYGHGCWYLEGCTSMKLWFVGEDAIKAKDDIGDRVLHVDALDKLSQHVSDDGTKALYLIALSILGRTLW